MKAIQSIFILLFVAIVFASNSKHIIHPFSKKELGHLLSKKSDKNVVLVFMSKSCQECEKKLYDINVAFNAYDEYKDLVFGTVKAESYPSLVRKYDVDLDSELPEVRLIFKNKRYTEYTDGYIPDWIGNELNITAKTSYVYELTPEVYKQLGEAKKDLLIEYYQPTCTHCQELIWVMEQLAYTFSNEPRLAVAKVDCIRYERFCGSYHIDRYPTFKFFKPDPNAVPENIESPGTEYSVVSGDKKSIESKRVIGGGFDDEYGTSVKLSRLSKDFVDEPLMEYKQKILKEIKETQLKKVPLYTHYLEKSLTEGNEYLVNEFKKISEKMEKITFLDEKYPEMKQKYNILKSIQPTDFNQLIELNTLNIDHYLNGHRNVLVVFLQKDHEKCIAFMENYKKAVLRKPEGVMFAYLYGDTYTTLSSRYQLHTTPAFKWFAINADPSKPEEAGLGGTVDSIIDYVEEQLANQKEDEEL